MYSFRLTRYLVSNQRGFGILEAVIATSIALVAILAMGQQMHWLHQTVAYLEAKISRTDLNNDLALNLSQPNYCTDTFAGLILPQDGEVNTTIRDLEGNVALDVNHPNLSFYGSLKADRIYFKDLTTAGPNSSGIAEIVIEPSTKDGKKKLQPISKKLRVDLDNAGAVASCRQVGGAGGSGDCLKLLGSANRGSFLSASTFPLEVPENAVLLRLDTSHENFECRDNDGDRWTCAGSPHDVIIYFGITEVNGQVLQAGGTLTHIGSDDYGYQGVTIRARRPSCYDFIQSCHEMQTNVPIGSSTGALCPSTTPTGFAQVWGYE